MFKISNRVIVLLIALSTKNVFAISVVPEVNLPLTFKMQKSILQQMRLAENQEKWALCVQLANKTFAKDSNLRGWILTSWLRCARKSESKLTQFPNSKKALIAFDLNSQLRINGPWVKRLNKEALQTRFLFIDSTLNNNYQSLSAEDFNKLVELSETGDKNEQARAISLYADWAKKQRDYETAKAFYQQSLDLRESSAVRERLQSVVLALNEVSETESSQQTTGDVYVSETERKFNERFENSIKNNDHLALVEDCISYLNRFPNGRRSRWAHEKVIDTYFYFFDRGRGYLANGNEDEKWQALQEKAISSMSKAEVSRLQDWAKTLHRRNDFLGSYKIAESALSLMGVQSDAAKILYIAGRSAHFLGEDKKAQKHYEQYIDQHSAGEDFSEVLFRLGLIHLRREQYASAVAVFERLLSQPNQDKYELSARYWLIRALQFQKSPRVSIENDILQKKFPFTFFALKLRAEFNQNQIDWPGAEGVAAENKNSTKAFLRLTSLQKKAWDRMLLLAASGWRDEALQESLELPIPNDSKTQALLAQTFSDSQSYLLAIRLINQVVDKSLDLRSRNLLTYAFPKDQEAIVNAESKKSLLSSTLIWSLMRQESGFNPYAVSRSQAAGYMQLIPPTARDVAKELKIVLDEIPEDLFSAERNIAMGTHYLASLIKQFQGGVPVALAAYNAGPQKMKVFLSARSQLADSIINPPKQALDELWMDELPWSETSFYVKAILRNILIYRLLDEGRVNFTNDFWTKLVLSPNQNSSSQNSQQSAR